MRKYASLEQAQVLDLKGSKHRSKTASLNKIADFHDYRTEDGYLYARIRAISSRVNKNHDGWPSVELAGGEEIFNRHAKTSSEGFTLTASEGNNKYGFATFLGKPIFVDHNNSDPSRARGVIVDAKLHVEDHKTAALDDPYYASAPDNHMPPTWVELLLEVDAKSFPKLAKAIIAGSKDPKRGIDGFSMGCDVERSVCNICKNSATSPDDFCNHVKLKGAEFDSLDSNGKRTSKRSYEDCYGVKFFEISAVFDPADETALIREVRSSITKEADEASWLPPRPGDQPDPSGLAQPCPQCRGIEGNMMCQMCHGTGSLRPGDGVMSPNYMDMGYGGPQTGAMLDAMERKVHQPGGLRMYEGSTKTAENPEPQSDMMTMPEAVDTLREEEVCPVCGSSMEEGHQCDVCGYVPPPDGLDNPDLQKAQGLDQLFEQGQDGQLDQAPPTDLGQGPPTQVNTDPNNMTPVASVRSDMGWQIIPPRTSGRINPVERPLKPGNAPITNEPRETVISDQDKPVTNRTAASMIAAVNQENNMSRRNAADAPTQDTKADKRVDVNGVGGVMQGTNEEASRPDADSTVDGKGGIIQDSNAEASKPDHTESLPTAGEGSDDSGFNKDKNINSDQKTRTWDNSNEPGSAVTDKVFSPWSASQHDAAKQGVQPHSGPGVFDTKQQDRVNVESDEFWNTKGTDTDQWTGTGGNGVTRQQDPVTKKVDPGIDVKKMTSVVELFKIADLEVELGLVNPEDKYDRIAELEQASAEEIQATSKVLARVKTAGLARRTAATTPQGIGRVPSMRSTARTAHVERDESIFW